ncbi:MAG: hypothetical protein JNM86_16415 [Phycisphaerae bacterium]|nr:hypothetical protein [Phycisphaerae bacterium]
MTRATFKQFRPRRLSFCGAISASLGVSALVGCSSGGASPNQLIINNDSNVSVAALVWAGDALPSDPQASVKQDDAIAGTIAAGGSWHVDLPARTPGAPGGPSTATVATVAVREAGSDLATSQWINVEDPRPWMIRVFGESPNLRVARILQQSDDRRMQRTVGPRPPSVSTGGFGSGPQR